MKNRAGIQGEDPPRAVLVPTLAPAAPHRSLQDLVTVYVPLILDILLNVKGPGAV